ncbi:hypothetical protein [Thermomonas sp.]|uniref:hypothetical protein n=1 Tax=Thermomonas sp. TaxID=1971895 RepID=UPI0035B1549F
MSKPFHATDKRRKHTGRGGGHTFLSLPHYVITSPQWRALSGNAIKFIVELAAEFDGSNNGDLSLTRCMALKRGWRSGETRDQAAEEAEAAGFIVQTRHGHKGVCNLYAITWKPIDDVGKGTELAPERVASCLWKQRDPMPRNWRRVAQNLAKAS